MKKFKIKIFLNLKKKKKKKKDPLTPAGVRLGGAGWGWIYFTLPLCWFSLNNVACSSISLETSVQNLVFLTRPSLQILGKTQGYFQFSVFRFHL